MTTVVAVENAGGVTFAADSRVSGGALNDGVVNKIVRNGRYVFAAAGFLRTVQILEFAKLPEPPRGVSDDGVDRFVTVELVSAIVDAFKDADSGENALSESVILVAVLGRLYAVYPDGAWIRPPFGALAIGSGADFALGALTAGASPRRAVEIAARYDAGTNDDVRVVRASK